MSTQNAQCTSTTSPVHQSSPKEGAVHRRGVPGLQQGFGVVCGTAGDNGLSS